MASLFRARRRRSPEDDGEEEYRSASGRVTRRRLSPEVGALSLDEAEAGASVSAAAGTESTPGWLSSIVSGARRVISSVLFSSPEEAASGEEEDEDDEEDETEDNHAIVSYDESKLAIEEMVMKETFSRDECNKMVKLIQSRVTDSALPEAREYGMPKEIPSRNTAIGNDFTGAWRSLSRNRNVTEPVPFSSIGSGNFSPGSLHASPEQLSAAVMEAKKWLEEKRQGLGSKPEDHGPCILNTDTLNSGFESDMGSPVDLAKSYMQSLPPWQSPFLGSQKFKTPPSAGLHIYDDAGKSKYSLSSSKVTTKEDYLSNFWDNLEESRRSRLGSSGSSPDAFKVKQYGSTSILFENDTSIFSSDTHKKVDKPEQNNKGSDKVAGAELANGHSSPIAPTKDKNDVVVDPVDPAKDIGNVVKECNAASKVHIEEASQGNHTSSTSVTKDAADRDEDFKAPVAEPEIHVESNINSASELRTKDTGSHIHASLNGSTKKTSGNGLRDQSNANSGLESSGNDNPSCTNSSSAVPPASNEFIDLTTDAADGDSIQNGTRLNSEEPAQVDPKPSYVRRGRKRVVRGTRGRAK